MKRIAVIGAGIGGLTCAFTLRQRDPSADVVILEASDTPGGKVRTVRQDGFLVEAGPDAFLHSQPEAVDLCRELGLGDALVPTDVVRTAVYVLAKNKLHALPRGLMLVAPTDAIAFLRSDLLSLSGRLRASVEPVIPARRSDADESIGAFVTRRLGRQVTDRLAQPLLGGIFGGDVYRLSLRDTFPDLAAMEREHGSLFAGAKARSARVRPDAVWPGAFVSLAGGLDTMVTALAESLGSNVLRTGRRVTGLEVRHNSGGDHYRVLLDDGTHHDADEVVVGLPAPAAVTVIHPVAPHVARGLAQLTHLSTAVVSLGFRERDVGRPLDGYGFLVASREAVAIRGCTWSSTKLPGRSPEGHVLLRAFVGGAGREADVALDQGQLVELAVGALRTPMRLSGGPVFTRVDRWAQAQPQYELGHRERVREIRGGCPPGIHLIGASYDGVGIPAVIRSARAAAATILTGGLDSRPQSDQSPDLH